MKVYIFAHDPYLLVGLCGCALCLSHSGTWVAELPLFGTFLPFVAERKTTQEDLALYLMDVVNSLAKTSHMGSE